MAAQGEESGGFAQSPVSGGSQKHAGLGAGRRAAAAAVGCAASWSRCLNVRQVLSFRHKPIDPCGSVSSVAECSDDELTLLLQLPARLAFVATSARSLVECACASGFSPIALDVFGDIDTGRLAEPALLIAGTGRAMDRAALLAALPALGARGDVAGWVAGAASRGPARPARRGCGVLPLLGNSPKRRAPRRSPADFAAGRALGIAQPGFSAAPATRSARLGW